MRDLRALVTGSDVARDEASRGLAVALREALDRRVEAQWAEWASEITASLDAGQLARALRLSSRPPDIAARFPADLATRLRDAASAALSPEKTPDQWLSLLQAVVASPIRRTVKPAGLPHEPTPALLEAARQHCGRVPALAGLLGLTVPPPPGPARPMPGHRPVVLRPGSQRRARPRPPAQRAAAAKVRSRSPRAGDVPGTNEAGQPVGDASSEPADVTAQQTDVTGPPAELTAEPAELTAEPADVTGPSAELTAEATDVTAEPADATGLLAGATVEPTADVPDELADVRGEPADVAGGPAGASAEPAADEPSPRIADEAISAGPAYDQEAEPSPL